MLLKTHFLDDIAFLEDIYKREGIAQIDNMNYVTSSMDKSVRPDQDPLKLLRAFKGKARNKAEISIRYNTIDYTGRVTGKGLVDVLKPVSKIKRTS